MKQITIGKNIATLRKKSGITQVALAQKLHVSNQAVSKWESGNACPDIHLLPKLADFFEISIDELLVGEAVSENSEKTANNGIT